MKVEVVGSRGVSASDNELHKNTCCFTGHRSLPTEELIQIICSLDCEMEGLIEKGVSDFMSGGALGFDQIAAALVVAKKEMGKAIRLIFVLPCKNQDALWSEEQKNLYRGLLGEADEIRYVSRDYDDSCMEKRNRYMIDHAAYCICALNRERSGTGQTVRYAREKGLRIINVAK